MSLQEENDRLRLELARCRWILIQLPTDVLIAFQRLWDMTKDEVKKS